MFCTLIGTGDAQEKVRLEGPIQRKHEWENTGTKASHRTWDKLFAILNDTSVSFYKDQKQAKTVSIVAVIVSHHMLLMMTINGIQRFQIEYQFVEKHNENKSFCR